MRCLNVYFTHERCPLHQYASQLVRPDTSQLVRPDFSSLFYYIYVITVNKTTLKEVYYNIMLYSYHYQNKAVY